MAPCPSVGRQSFTKNPGVLVPPGVAGEAMPQDAGEQQENQWPCRPRTGQPTVTRCNAHNMCPTQSALPERMEALYFRERAKLLPDLSFTDYTDCSPTCSQWNLDMNG